jgi:heterodisulfide reductase subunit A
MSEDPATGNLQIYYEDIVTGKMNNLNAEMVVLCPALVPKADNKKIAETTGLELDDYGFFKSRDNLTAPVDTNIEGIYSCGYCQGPKDIPESVAQASGAAAKAAEIISNTMRKIES